MLPLKRTLAIKFQKQLLLPDTYRWSSAVVRHIGRQQRSFATDKKTKKANKRVLPGFEKDESKLSVCNMFVQDRSL